MLKQLVVHLPEFPLFVRGFSGFCCSQRMRMRLNSRKVTKHKAQIVTQKGS